MDMNYGVRFFQPISVTERPAKTDAEMLAEAQTSKRAEVQAGYAAAVAASLTMP